jgi:DNA-binding transcriptional MerR regulator
MLTIGKLALEADLTANALRFYEREGLLSRAPRRPPTTAYMVPMPWRA